MSDRAIVGDFVQGMIDRVRLPEDVISQDPDRRSRAAGGSEGFVWLAYEQNTWYHWFAFSYIQKGTSLTVKMCSYRTRTFNLNLPDTIMIENWISEILAVRRAEHAHKIGRGLADFCECPQHMDKRGIVD